MNSTIYKVLFSIRWALGGVFLLPFNACVLFNLPSFDNPPYRLPHEHCNWQTPLLNSAEPWRNLSITIPLVLIPLIYQQYTIILLDCTMTSTMNKLLFSIPLSLWRTFSIAILSVLILVTSGLVNGCIVLYENVISDARRTLINKMLSIMALYLFCYSASLCSFMEWRSENIEEEIF